MGMQTKLPFMPADLTHKKIAVLMGGPGSERKVSLASGAGVVKALRELGADVTEVDVEGPDFVFHRKPRSFNVIHGTFGEDGQVQRILEARGNSLHRRRRRRQRARDRQDRNQTAVDRSRRADRAV